MNKLLKILLLGTALSTTPAFADHAPHGTAPVAEHDGAVQAGDLTISGAFSRATLPRSPVGGGYMTIENYGAEDDRLISVSAPVGKEVQIHEMAHTDGVMSMRQLTEGLAIPAGQTVSLEPSGYHLMLIGLTEPLVEGGSLDMVLHFEKAGDVTVAFDILALNARHGKAHMDHSAAERGDHSGHGRHGAPAFDQTSIRGDEARIVGLLKEMFETPENPLAVAPVLVDGDVAIIGWAQDSNGGRALLHRDEHGLWRISLCAGDGLKGADNMVALGVDAEVAARLAVAQEAAEAELPSEQVASFSLFDGILHVDQDSGH